MKILKGMIIAALAFSTTVIVMAQPTEAGKDIVKKERTEKTPEKRAEKMTHRMTENLDLTDEQAKRVYDLQLEFAEADKVEREAKKAQRAEREGKMKAILSADQITKFEEMKSKGEGKRKGRKGKRGKKRRGQNENGEIKDSKEN